jgi:phosphate transport system substrate-binding protein
MLKKFNMLFWGLCFFCRLLAAHDVIIVADNISSFLKKTVEPFHESSGIHVLVRAGDSTTGLASLLDHQEHIDIAAITRDLEDNDKSRYPSLVEHPIASDCLVFIVHPSNPLINLSKEQVQAIYTKKSMKWSDVIPNYNGKLSNEPIYPMSKSLNNGSFKPFMKYFKFDHTEQKEKSLFFYDSVNQDPRPVAVVTTDQAAIAQLAVKPNAIAFVSLTALSSYKPGKDFKIVAYNRVVPSIKTVFNRTYPLSYHLNFVLNQQNISHEAQAYVDWILEADGQDIFREFGLAPINLKTKIIKSNSSLTKFRHY